MVTRRRAKPSKNKKTESQEDSVSSKQKKSCFKKCIIASSILVGVIGIISGIVCIQRQGRQPTSMKVPSQASTKVPRQASIHSAQLSDDHEDLLRSYRSENNKIILALHPSNKKYDLSKYSKGVVALSIDAFLSASVQFCHKEGRQGQVEIISVGSGSGFIENEIIAAYRTAFKNDIKITLVDINPAFKTDYRTVEELISERPEIIGNCVLIINWPEPVGTGENDCYDIDAVRYLLPRAVLAVYETQGSSGSRDFIEFLRNDSFKFSSKEYGFFNSDENETIRGRKYSDLENKYSIEELALQKVSQGIWGTRVYRMVVIRKKEETQISEDEINELNRTETFLRATNKNVDNFYSYVADSKLDWPTVRDIFLSELPRAVKKEINSRQYNMLSYRPENTILSLATLLMETFTTEAVEFCGIEKHKKKREIIFLGSRGYELVPKIIAAYREKYGSDIEITLIDTSSNPRINSDYVTRFQSVRELVQRNPEIVGQNSLFIFWPQPNLSRPPSSKDDRVDMNAIRMLRPRAILTAYETNGLSGSDHFQVFLRNDSFELPFSECGFLNILNAESLSSVNNDDLKVPDDYLVEEKTLEKIAISRISGTILLRIVLLKQKGQ